MRCTQRSWYLRQAELLCFFFDPCNNLLGTVSKPSSHLPKSSPSWLKMLLHVILILWQRQCFPANANRSLKFLGNSFKQIGTTSPPYGNPSSVGIPNLMLTFLLVLALAIAQICSLLWKMRSSVSLGRLDGNPMNYLKELRQREWKPFYRVLVCVSIISAVYRKYGCM